VNCTTVRELLPEHALGVADGDADAIERHLASCAACRREARDLQGASASLAFALAPVAAPAGLEERVVGAVTGPAGVAPRRRRARRGATLLLAAAVAIAGLGGGAVLARREPPADPGLSQQRAIDERNDLLTFVQNTIGRDTVAVLGVLRPGDDAAGGGSAVALVNGRRDDQVMVIANGLRARGVPYRIQLADGEGRFIDVGRARAVDGGGGFTVALVTPVDLTGFVNVLVRDRRGDVVLSGTLREDAPISSPSVSPAP
jgi:hypothetical protein